MRILVDGSIFQLMRVGGIIRVFSEILPRLCHRRADVKVTLVLNEGANPRILSASGVSTLRTPDLRKVLRPGRLFNSWLTPVLQESLTRYRLNFRGKNTIWHPTYYVMPPRGWKGRFVLTVHDMIHERFPQLLSSEDDKKWREAKRQCIASADIIICVSNATADDLRKFYSSAAGKIRVVRLGHSNLRPADRPARSLPIDGPFVLYVGLRHEYKNFCTLLKAFASWPHRGEVALCVVGPAWNEHETATMRTFGIGERVIALKEVSDDELMGLYSRAAAFVYPSLYEGFGLPLLEAMAAGCPIVASRIPSTIEVAGAYPTYFEPGDPEGLARALSSAIDEGKTPANRRLAEELLKEFSWDRAAERTLKCYEEVLNVQN